jgi:hypothetical protein
MSTVVPIVPVASAPDPSHGGPTTRRSELLDTTAPYAEQSEACALERTARSDSGVRAGGELTTPRCLRSSGSREPARFHRFVGARGYREPCEHRGDSTPETNALIDNVREWGACAKARARPFSATSCPLANAVPRCALERPARALAPTRAVQLAVWIARIALGSDYDSRATSSSQTNIARRGERSRITTGNSMCKA